MRSFRTLRYAGLWPGVQARVYESADQHLEYDFELAPGADPAAIGAPPEALTPEGWLRILPSQWAERGGVDGFFVAKLERIEG